jgi:hypothetical protein
MKKIGVWILVIALFIIMMMINMLNQGSPGGADTYMHYLFAKWSFIHPHLFFDHWGKPMFTILAAPLAQFGFKGAVTFNIIISILSGLLVSKSAEKLNIQNAWTGVLFTVFTPMFFLISFSSLTEILFAFLTILSIYLFTDKKFIWSTLIISFIPFARTEGIIFFPLIIMALIFVRHYKSIPFLLTGFIVMSIAGYPVYEDLLWPITKNPYHDSSALYGHGKLLHFIDYSPDIFGWPIIILFFVGLITSIIYLFKYKLNHTNISLLLIFSISIGYFSAHSFVWAFGMGGSAGLIRVMAGIAPTIALIALLGFHSLFEKLPNIKWIKWSFISIILILILIEGTTKNKFPISQGQEEVVLLQAANYLKNNQLDTNYIIYNNPLNAYLLGLDHFSDSHSRNQLYDNNQPHKDLPTGTIIIWDAHFSPNESGLPKINLEQDSLIKPIKEFKPEHPFQVYGGQEYEVLIFQKK